MIKKKEEKERWRRKREKREKREEKRRETEGTRWRSRVRGLTDVIGRWEGGPVTQSGTGTVQYNEPE